MRKKIKPPRKSFWLRIHRGKFVSGLLLVGGLIVAGALLVFPHYHKRWVQVATSMEQVTSEKYNQLYGGEYFVKIGMNIAQEQLFVRLHSLGYTLGSPETKAGTYRLDDQKIIIHPLGPGSSSLYTLNLSRGTVANIQQVSLSAKVIRSLSLGRPLLTSYRDTIWEQREVLSYADFPEHFIQAVTMAEDNRFFAHHGLDFKGICRAAVVNIRHQSVKQGGSTITQQLIKTFLKRTQRTYTEKLFEAVMALHLEFFYSKQEILTAYFNNVYMGHIGPFPVHGVGAAARLYLGKDVKALQPGESAMLAVMVRSPNLLTPGEDNHRNLVRAVKVLREMKQQNLLNSDYIYDPFAVTSDGGKKEQEQLLTSAWAIDALERELAKYTSPLLKQGGPQRIETSLDPHLQHQTAISLVNQLELLEQQGKVEPFLQGAAVIVEQRTGGIKALVGGRDYLASQFNRAILAQRPVGSLIKPFVYLAAMGIDPMISPTTVFLDTPMRVNVGNNTWKPHNFDNHYKGPVTLEQALVTSRNIPAVRAGFKASVKRVAAMVQAVGISDKAQIYPSLFLGSCLSSPLRMAAAYGAIAQEGAYVRPQLVDRVIVGESVVILRRSLLKQVLDARDCSVMAGMLEKVLTVGTGRSARKWGVDKAGNGGKTGTSNNFRDAWFAGFSDDLTAVVWVGNDGNKSIGMTGAKAALPVWAEVMQGRSGKREQEVVFTSTPHIAVSKEKEARSESIEKNTKPSPTKSSPTPQLSPKKKVKKQLTSNEQLVVSSEDKSQPLKHQRYKFFQ